jgi:hypothetical protein
VTKPIGKYEPLKEENKRHFDPNPNTISKKTFPDTPVTHKDQREIQRELTGE